MAMAMVKFESASGGTVWLNPAQVRMIKPAADNPQLTTIFFAEHSLLLTIKEPPEIVAQRLS
jgi:hypothetical protein